MKLKIIFSVIILLLISALSVYAQGGGVDPEPCGPTDIDDQNCPLDTWVIVLVVAGCIFAAFRLYDRKRSAVRTIR